jgi:hypothetical protein
MEGPLAYARGSDVGDTPPLPRSPTPPLFRHWLPRLIAIL